MAYVLLWSSIKTKNPGTFARVMDIRPRPRLRFADANITMKAFFSVCFLCLSIATIVAQPTFTFECLCGTLTASAGNCDVCNTSTQSRTFRGLIIRRLGVPHRWIDEPYIIIQNFEALTFRELLPNGEQIRIERSATQFATMQHFIDSTNCACALSAVVDSTEIQVDTPIVGTGTPANPVTIGQFGADTMSYLRWVGNYWYPSRVFQSHIFNDLPYYLNDNDAIAAGLAPGKTYLLAQGNTLALPVGMYKVVIGCGYVCSVPIRFFQSDVAAQSNNIPTGQLYALKINNFYGVLYGFVKAVYANFDNDSLVCNVSLPVYANDAAAQAGGLQIGDFYCMSTNNTYGAPAGAVRVVSTATTEEGDSPVCCDNDSTLPYYNNDAHAAAGGVSVGQYYLLLNTNTYGWPAGTKKRRTL